VVPISQTLSGQHFRPLENTVTDEQFREQSYILRFSASHKLDIAVCGIRHNGKRNLVEHGVVIDL
jgi:hypothetical protein